MWDNHPIQYIEPVYRPPAEAESLLLQLTIGCSHNSCTFCAMYRGKRFRVREFPEIATDIEAATRAFAQHGDTPRKIFLCDGDALAAPTELLLRVLNEIHERLPQTTRVGIYASAGNILAKSEAELQLLAQHHLRLAYIGIESGSNDVLSLIHKSATAEETATACRRLRNAGWKVSAIIMLGVGGTQLSSSHCEESAKLLSEVTPNFLSFLTTTVVPGTPYAKAVEQGKIQPLSARELLQEMEAILRLTVPGHGRIIFRANHASNYFPLEGTLPRDTEKLLRVLRAWIEECPPDLYLENDPRRL